MRTGCNKPVYESDSLYRGRVPSSPRRPPGPLGKAFADALRAELGNQGLTQSQLAQMVGLSQSQVSVYLRGDKGITIDEADDMARALGMRLCEVIEEAESGD